VTVSDSETGQKRGGRGDVQSLLALALPYWAEDLILSVHHKGLIIDCRTNLLTNPPQAASIFTGNREWPERESWLLSSQRRWYHPTIARYDL
jgi:hypothetical protein